MIIVATMLFVGTTNAQSFQTTTFNDGRLLAYIDQSTGFCFNLQRNVRRDALVLQNLTNSEIRVNYSFRIIAQCGILPGDRAHCGNRSEQIVNREVTIRPGATYRPNAFYRTRNCRHTQESWVDGFHIRNVSVIATSTPNFHHPPQQNFHHPPQQWDNNVRVPSWAQGSWRNVNNGRILRITSTQLVFDDGSSFMVNLDDGNRVFFDDSHFVIRRTNSHNQIILRIFVRGEWSEDFIFNR